MSLYYIDNYSIFIFHVDFLSAFFKVEVCYANYGWRTGTGIQAFTAGTQAVYCRYAVSWKIGIPRVIIIVH